MVKNEESKFQPLKSCKQYLGLRVIQRHTLMAFQTSLDGCYFLKELKLSHCIIIFCALSAHSSENKETLWGKRSSMHQEYLCVASVIL